MVSAAFFTLIRRCILLAGSFTLVFVSLTELRPAPLSQPAPAGPPVKAALVQYEVRAADYQSEAAFAERVGALTAEAAARGAKILVFPEYINVFLAALPLGRRLALTDTLPGALQLVQEYHRRPVGLREHLRLQSSSTREVMDRVWGSLARRHNVWIIAGSAFVAETDKAASAPKKRPQLLNRAFVYAPSGQVAYTQDKVYLTPFEKNTIGLSPGDISEARVFEAAGLDIALTLCRDTFFDIWNSRMGEADVWVDLKANGVEFDQQSRQLFREAVPERIAETEVPYGFTVCLTGRYLELFWEGRSSVVVPADQGAGYKTIQKTEKPVGEEMLIIKIEGGA